MDNDRTISKKIAFAFHPKYTLSEKQLMNYRDGLGSYEYEDDEIDDALEFSREKLNSVLREIGVREDTSTANNDRSQPPPPPPTPPTPLQQSATAAAVTPPQPTPLQQSATPAAVTPPQPPSSQQSATAATATAATTQQSKWKFPWWKKSTEGDTPVATAPANTSDQIEREKQPITQFTNNLPNVNEILTANNELNDNFLTKTEAYVQFYQNLTNFFVDERNSVAFSKISKIEDVENFEFIIKEKLIKLIKKYDKDLKPSIENILTNNKLDDINNKLGNMAPSELITRVDRIALRERKKNIIDMIIGKKNPNDSTTYEYVGAKELVDKLSQAYFTQINQSSRTGWNPFRGGGTRKMRRSHRSKKRTKRR